MDRKPIVISVNASWNIYNFRGALVLALRKAGYDVTALAPEDEYSPRLAELGISYQAIAIDKQGMSPLRDLKLLGSYALALRRLRPMLFLGFTAKPNIYGSLAAHWLGIPVVNNVSGLGTAFIREGWLTSIVSALYRVAFRRSATVFFQNDEDRQLFLANGIVRPAQAELLPGSGVDTARFQPGEGGRGDGQVAFLFVGRLLWDKGVGEFVEAARLVRKQYPDARFRMLGFVDAPNRTAVAQSDVDGWVAEGLIEFLPPCDDVRPHIADADCIVLPSYREGMPRVLLEGAAMAKPLIAADVPGCRAIVEDGVNGLLCTVRDSQALADAMMRMITTGEAGRRTMGASGRRKVEAEFDQRIVISRYLDAIERALAGS